MSPKAEEIKGRILARLCVVNGSTAPDGFRFYVYRSTEKSEEINNYLYRITAHMPYEHSEFPEKLEEDVAGETDEQALERAERSYILKARRIAAEALTAILGEEVEYEDMEFVINSLKLRLRQKMVDRE